jgi:hypothetical protein
MISNTMVSLFLLDNDSILILVNILILITGI